VSGIALDCQGHQVQSLNLLNVSNVTVANCQMSYGVALPGVPVPVGLALQNVTDVQVTSSTIASGVYGDTLARVTLDQDTVITQGIQLYAAGAVHITNSQLSGGTYVIWFSNGHDNVIDGNTLDGH
jgi:hypothetical protein